MFDEDLVDGDDADAAQANPLFPLFQVAAQQVLAQMPVQLQMLCDGRQRHLLTQMEHQASRAKL